MIIKEVLEMQGKSKSIIFSLFRKARKLLQSKGIGNLPGFMALHDFLFWHLLPKESIVEIQGSKMYMNPDNLPKRFKRTFRSYIISGVWEELTTEMFRRVIKKGDIVVDLGANIGYFTLLAARLVGKEGKVYAFEPEPVNYSLLLKNIEINGYKNIVPVQKAISSTTGTVRLFIDNEDSGGHTIRQYNDKMEFVEIESVTLDDYFRDKGHPINVIKMDIEGAEMAALSGMNRIIKENKNLKMFVEFYFPGIRRSGDSPEEFARRLLEDYHFSILAISDYTKNRKHLRINNVDELMNLCKGEKTANLFLEKG